MRFARARRQAGKATGKRPRHDPDGYADPAQALYPLAPAESEGSLFSGIHFDIEPHVLVAFEHPAGVLFQGVETVRVNLAQDVQRLRATPDYGVKHEDSPLFAELFRTRRCRLRAAES
jgi:hypothetical protein